MPYDIILVHIELGYETLPRQLLRREHLLQRLQFGETMTQGRVFRISLPTVEWSSFSRRAVEILHPLEGVHDIIVS